WVLEGTYLSKITDFAAKKWDQLYHAEKTSWKGKLYITGQQLLDRIDHQEYFLKSIPLKEEVEKNFSSKENMNVKNNLQMNEKGGKCATEEEKNNDRLIPTDSNVLDQIYDGIDLNNYDILDENRIHQIAHEFNVLTMDTDVKRARHQILEKIESESQG
ncbi:4835_t:CDS:2, partial [Racocetra fulgida]